MTNASIEVESYEDWYRMAGEFFRNCEGATAEQIDAGHKALCLAWIGLKQEPKPHEVYRAGILLDMAGRRLLQAELWGHA